MASSREGTTGTYGNYIRPALRSATLIIPRTGERVKRVVTLVSPSDCSSSDDEEQEETEGRNGHANGHTSSFRPRSNQRTPLLGRQHRRSRRVPVSLFRRRMDKVKDAAKARFKTWKTFWMSRTGQGILKCSLAYLLGSMGTFLPFLGNFLGHQDGKHMVATVTVYFHPARSMGSMFEALFCAFIAFVYAAFISVTSMSVTVLFDDVFHLIIFGHIIVLIVFCGGGLGLVGWTKQHLSNPLVNVGCSLTSLAIITVLTKEGSIQAGEFNMAKIVQVLKMVVLGCVMSTLVCFAVNPISSHRELKQSLIEVTDSLGDSLSMTTRAFLTGSEEELENETYQKVATLYDKRSAAMSKHLKEAKWEHYVFGRETEYWLEARLVQCIQRLSQNIGGLRSAARSQFSLLAQQTSGYGDGDSPSNSKKHGAVSFGLESPQMESSMTDSMIYSSLSAITETNEESHAARMDGVEMLDGDELVGLDSVRSPREIFDIFIDQLGPSIRSLAYTLRQILDDLPYGPAPDFPIALAPHFRSSLDQAIELYSHARQDALSSLYQRREMHITQPRALAADFEEVAACCGYFSYSLLNFAEELRTYLAIINELQAHETSETVRSWSWLHFWSPRRRTRARRNSVGDEEPILIIPTHKGSGQHDDPVDGNVRTKPHHWRSTTPEQSPWRRQLWKWAHILRREDVKFAMKVGLGASLYALPSFMPSTRPIYGRFRGEWGLLSYMLVCSMTIGSSNTTGFARGWGTCVGAIAAILSWYTSQGNAIALALFGWLMALCTFYITVAKGNGPLGRFIMLTYNLSCLYAYSLSVKDDDHDDDEGGRDPDILDIAFHRVVAVLSGCVWGLIVTRLVWPISARRKFHDGLGVLLLRMALIWRRDPLDKILDASETSSAPHHPYMDLAEEFQLQQYLNQLHGLRHAAAAEYELRGPFPKVEFGRILNRVGRMLDAFHSMNVIITKDLRASPGELAILRYTRAERQYLSTRIGHLFQVLAASLRLQFPFLNDALPSSDNARDRLLAKVFRFRHNNGYRQPPRRSESPAALRSTSNPSTPNMASSSSSAYFPSAAPGPGQQSSQVSRDADYALLYAYSLVTMQLAREIHAVAAELGRLYGVLDEERLKLQ